MKKEKEILRILPERIRIAAKKRMDDWESLQEIHLRQGKAVAFTISGKKYVDDENGKVVSEGELRELIEYVCSYSLYAFEEEIRRGFLTIPGGHRAGVCGQVVVENNRVRNMRHISFVNIRVAHEKKGCSDDLLPLLMENERFLPTLIASSPGGGKTTLLRDLSRNLATGKKDRMAKNVSVVDERSEIAACYLGVPQNDMGICCDVMDGCPKPEGIRMMLRTMAPEVIVVDEIGTVSEVEAATEALTGGCSLLAAVHASSMEDLRRKPVWEKMLREKMFERFVFLSGRKNPGEVAMVLDASGEEVFP